MGNYNLKVNIETLNAINKNVDTYGNQLVSVIEKCRNMMISLENYYNTPNSKAIIEVVCEYLTKRQNYVKNRYLPVTEQVKMIGKEYTDFSIDVANSIK